MLNFRGSNYNQHMNPMKATFTSLVVLFSLFTCTSSAQIEKGAWLINSSANLGTRLSVPDNNYSFFIAPSAGYFITDKWLLGTGIAYGHSTNKRPESEFTFNNFSVAPFVRYYFPREDRVMHWFATLGSNFTNNKSELQSTQIGNLENKSSAVEPFAGGGFNFFVNANVAVEGTLLYQGYFEDDFDTHALFYNIGLQFFLPPGPVDGYNMDNAIALSKSSWMLGLSAEGGWLDIGGFDNFFGSLTPSAGYFLTDRFVLGAAFQLAFADQNAIIYPQPFARYYIGKIGSPLQPFATAGFGTRFQFADKADDPGFFNLNLTAGAGLNYFLTPNVALEGLLKYDGRQLEDDFSTELLNFVIGFQFFLSSN